MNDESKHSSRANRDHMTPQADAKRAIISFLTGESCDIHKMTDAVHKLAQQAPDELVGLHHAILRTSHRPEDIYSECQDISECLPDYLALGDQASSRMPSVHLHLQSCDRCSDELTLLQDAVAHRPGWEELSEQLREAESPTLLTLIGQRWQWFSGKTRSLIALSDEDVLLGKRIGAWFLHQPPEVGFSFPDDSKPPLSLSISLPGNTALINLQVIPEYQATPQRWSWRLHLKMQQTSLTPEVHVGIGDMNRLLTGTRVLRSDRSAEFHMPPPTRDGYWLYFEWHLPEGEWQEHKVEVPLRSESSGRDA